MTPENLKAWRARLSLGEAGMAAYLGVPVTTYRKWENGTRKPDAAPLRLFEVLQMIEANAGDLHTLMVYEATKAENKPVKARKPRAATLAPASPEKRPSGRFTVPESPKIIGWIERGMDSIPIIESAAPAASPVPPWIRAADALPAWMNGGS